MIKQIASTRPPGINITMIITACMRRAQTSYQFGARYMAALWRQRARVGVTRHVSTYIPRIERPGAATVATAYCRMGWRIFRSPTAPSVPRFARRGWVQPLRLYVRPGWLRRKQRQRVASPVGCFTAARRPQINARLYNEEIVRRGGFMTAEHATHVAADRPTTTQFLPMRSLLSADRYMDPHTIRIRSPCP